jgi:hypothetical protein
MLTISPPINNKQILLAARPDGRVMESDSGIGKCSRRFCGTVQRREFWKTDRKKSREAGRSYLADFRN